MDIGVSDKVVKIVKESVRQYILEAHRLEHHLTFYIIYMRTHRI